jgi:uncharacterized protein Smg (DUF494 family)
MYFCFIICKTYSVAYSLTFTNNIRSHKKQPVIKQIIILDIKELILNSFSWIILLLILLIFRI